MTESRNTGSDVPGFRRAGVVKERCRPRRSGQTRDTNPVGSEACFIELESDGIGRRTQWLVIRGIISAAKEVAERVYEGRASGTEVPSADRK